MATVVTRWTSSEAKALRTALRMSQRVFADQVGVSGRMVAKWDTAATPIRLRSANQQALDGLLSKADSNAQERFLALTQAPAGESS
jgi:DNA-binding transcriptional regulator YiaG